MRSRGEALEMALLGLLIQEPLHGYELRKRLKSIFGPFRALSFSVLYPQLRRMMEIGLIKQESISKGGRSKRTRLVYSITELGKSRFNDLTEKANPGESMLLFLARRQSEVGSESWKGAFVASRNEQKSYVLI